MSVRRLFAFLAAVVLLLAQALTLAEEYGGLGADAAGFTEVVPGRALSFPSDLGPHPGFRIEWWYLTANLHDDAGAAYGAQWTLFRFAREPGKERNGWADKAVWMGHAALTSADAHLFTETMARGGIGQAGVVASPFRAWIDDWSFASAGDLLARATISANGPNFRYTLDLKSDRPLVLHGQNGFSRKSESGQASYYFSQPFFSVQGVLVLAEKEVKVSGQAWMDREWSSRPLAKDQKGWDWFSLHFSNGEKLMLYRFRAATNYYAGTWIAADGASQPLEGSDITVTPLEDRVIEGRKIPTRWRVQAKSRSLDVITTPLNNNSWMATRFSYWEGPISFDGTHRGEGYLEMTGY